MQSSIRPLAHDLAERQSTESSSPLGTYDLNLFNFYREVPICRCGKHMKLAVRQKLYSCATCDRSITQHSWDIVSFHGAVCAAVLDEHGIEEIVYHGVPLSREVAVQPSHLLPHIALTTIVTAAAAGMDNSFMLDVESIEETGDQATSLLGLYVSLVKPEAPLAESLQLIAAATRAAIADLHAESPGASIMDSTYLYDYTAE